MLRWAPLLVFITVVCCVSAQADRQHTSFNLPKAPATPPASLPSVPLPFDLTLSYALSTPCLLHFTSLLKAAAFTPCLPFSLLVDTSSAFATIVSDAIASTDFTALNDLLAYVANPTDAASCSALHKRSSASLNTKATCASDLAKASANPVALEAVVGFGNYDVMRGAAGLVEPTRGWYCYLDAVDRGADDLYLWRLPGGAALPKSSKPTCSPCSALLLSHLSQSISATPTLNSTLINNAITTVNSACGNGFVTVSAQATSPSSSSLAQWSPPPILLLFLVVIVAGFWGV